MLARKAWRWLSHSWKLGSAVQSCQYIDCALACYYRSNISVQIYLTVRNARKYPGSRIDWYAVTLEMDDANIEGRGRLLKTQERLDCFIMLLSFSQRWSTCILQWKNVYLWLRCQHRFRVGTKTKPNRALPRGRWLGSIIAYRCRPWRLSETVEYHIANLYWNSIYK